jgi:hypothetical protein
MQSLPLTTDRQKTEWKTIKIIAQSNNFSDKVITQLKSQTQQKTPKTRDNETNKNKKWAVFTYHSPRIRKLTNHFKHTETGIAFRSTNTIQQLTKPKPQGKISRTHKVHTKQRSTISIRATHTQQPAQIRTND